MRHHRSHSQLNDYLRCGHAFYLKRFRNLPEMPCVWLPAGKAFHSATEVFDRLTWQLPTAEFAGFVEDGLDVWPDLFTDAFEHELEVLRATTDVNESQWRTAGKATKDKPHGENILWWHTAGRDMVTAYVTWWANSIHDWEIAQLADQPGIEVELLHPFDGLPMKGWADRVLRSRHDGRLIVVDLKSGSRTPASPMQLATYSVQLEELMGEPCLWGAWYDARKGSLGEVTDLSRWTDPMLSRVYNTLDRGIEAGIFLPNIDSHCKGCAVAQFCIYNGGKEPSGKNPSQ